MGAVTLEQVREGAEPRLYPRDVLEGCESALVLFAAAWHGRQDAVWVAEAGLTGTCVDVDTFGLEEMRAAYPDGWEYVAGDAFEFALGADRVWDVVSIDCPSNLFERCAELLPRWCLLARKAVVLGQGSEAPRGIVVPQGWEWVDTVHRSNFLGGVYWMVFKPC